MGTAVPTMSPALSPHSLAATTSSSGPFFAPESYSLSFPPYDINEFPFHTPLKAAPHSFSHSLGFAPLVQNGGLMSSEDVKTRPRNMSSSSTDRELSSDVKPRRKDSDTLDGDSRSNPRKRASTDTVDYPRRRATIAVRSRFYVLREMIWRKAYL
jgi:hypothetical protein